MDTRTKIVPAEEALRLAQTGATVVSGYFDPLTSAHAERLEELKKAHAPLLVMIATGPDPILPAEARAALVAALAVVDYVCLATPGVAPHVQLEQEDIARLDLLIEHVHGRQQEAAG